MGRQAARPQPVLRRRSDGPAAGNSATSPAGEELPIPGRIASIRVEAPAGGGEAPLPPALRSGIEALTGTGLQDVRVHYNSDKPRALNALAYTQGHDIYLAPGGERQLPHEAWHVAQQQ